MGDFTIPKVEVANAPGPIAPFPGPIAPFPDPVVINDWGHVFVPHAFFPRSVISLPLCRGAALGWTPFPEVAGVLLAIFGGNPDALSDESMALTLSRDGLRALIADLQSIDDQLGEG